MTLRLLLEDVTGEPFPQLLLLPVAGSVAETRGLTLVNDRTKGSTTF
jgi:hypothetical protein